MKKFTASLSRLFLLGLLVSCASTQNMRGYQNSMPNPKSALLDFRFPVEGRSPTVHSLYGWRGARRMHEGIDFRAPIGTPVFSAERGVVLYVGKSLAGYGLIVVVGHGDDWSTVYAHLSRSFVKRGMKISKGQRIALSGNTGRTTGPHLHFEIRKGSDPLDPLLFLPRDRLRLP